MKKAINCTAILLILTLMSSSCATICGGSYYSAAINAKDHPGAEIYVNRDRAGKGVVTGNYRRDEPLIVEIRDEGCEDKEVTFDRSIRAGNVIFQDSFLDLLI